MLLKITRNQVDLVHSIPLDKIFPEIKIPNQCPIGGLFLLTKSYNNKLVVKEVTVDKILLRIMKMMFSEMNYYTNYANSYTYVNTKSIHEYFWNRYQNLLKNLINNVACYELLIPKNFDIEIFKHISSIIKND